MDRLSAKCRRTYYPASKSSGTRSLSRIKLVVLHDTEGGTAESNARYFHGANAKGSAHLVVDGKACYRCLADSSIPWAAPGANSTGVHIELAAYARWTRAQWLLRPLLLRRAAYKTAKYCKVYGLPPVFRTAAELRDGKRGVTTHAECTKAFGGDHTDPGPNFPLGVFMGLVRYYHKRVKP